MSNSFKFCYNGVVKEGLFGETDNVWTEHEVDMMFSQIWTDYDNNDNDMGVLTLTLRYLLIYFVKVLNEEIFILYPEMRTNFMDSNSNEIDLELVMDNYNQWQHIYWDFVKTFYETNNELFVNIIFTEVVYPSLDTIHQLKEELLKESKNILEENENIIYLMNDFIQEDYFEKQDNMTKKMEIIQNKKNEIDEELDVLYIFAVGLINEYGFFKNTKEMILHFAGFNDNYNVDKYEKKWLIWLVLLSPYLRLNEPFGESRWYKLFHKVFAPQSIAALLGDVFQSSTDWLLNDIGELTLSSSNEYYKQDVIRKGQTFKEYLMIGEYEYIRNELEKLPTKIGFLYGIQSISYVNDELLRSQLERLSHEDITQIYRRITDDGLERDPIKMRERIIDMNPHTIKNALTIIDENLMDSNRFTFLKLSNGFGVNIIDLVGLICSSKGENFQRGFASVDEHSAGRIWKDELELYHIIKFIYTFILKYINDISLQSIYNSMCEDMMDYIGNTKYEEITNKIYDEENFSEDKIIRKLGNLSELKLKKIEKIVAKIKIANSHQKHFVPLGCILSLIGEHEEKMCRIYEHLFKDIHVLHVIGYLGYIMMSDQVTSFDMDSSRFLLSTKCKDLVSKYLLHLYETDDGNENYYYYNQSETTKTNSKFNRFLHIHHVKSLTYNGDTLLDILDSSECLHGIGQSLCCLYLKTIIEMNEFLKNGMIKQKPFYIKNEIEPLSVFVGFGNNGEYGCFVKIIDDDVMMDFITGNEHKSYDQVNKEGFYKYVLFHYNVNTGRRGWCGKAYIYPANDENMQYNEIDEVREYMKTRVFNHSNIEFVREGYCPDEIETVLNFQKKNLCKILRACDIFCENRLEHFSIFLRYTIDYSNMLSDLYDNDILDKNGELDISKLEKENQYIYPSDNDEDGIDGSVESMMRYLYGSHALGMFSPKKEEFPEKINYLMDINARVMRDYDTNKQQLSKMVYFYDVLARNAEIYHRDIRTDERQLFGLYKEYENQPIGNALLSKLNKSYTFNQLFIKKVMMSQVLLKVLDRDYTQTIHSFLENNDTKSVYKLLKYNVQEMFDYINIESFLIIPTTNNDMKTRFKYVCENMYKCVFSYLFVFSKLEHDIRLSIKANEPWLLPFREDIMKPIFMKYNVMDVFKTMDIEKMKSHYRDIQTFSEEQLRALCDRYEKKIEHLVKIIYMGLGKFLNLYCDSNMPCTQIFHISHMCHKKGLLTDIVQKLNVNDDFHELVKNNMDLFEVYYKNDEELFPEHRTNIYDSEWFIGQHVDMALKYNKLQNYCSDISFSLSRILNKINDLENIKILPSFDIPEMDDLIVWEVPNNIEKMIDDNLESLEHIIGRDVNDIQHSLDILSYILDTINNDDRMTGAWELTIVLICIYITKIIN